MGPSSLPVAQLIVTSEMEALMPRRVSMLRLPRELSALSVMTRSGRVRGLRAVRDTRPPSSSASIWVAPLFLPPVSQIESGIPVASHARWLLVVRPPRERSMA